MSNETLQAIGAGAGVVIIAALAYLAAWLKANTRLLQAHDQQLATVPPPRPPGQRRASDQVGGGTAPPAYPLWDQLNDPLSTGALPGQRYQECGEECCAMVIYEQHGVEIAADALRAWLGGPGRSGLTTGEDLGRILTRANVACSVADVGDDALARQLQAATAAGRSCITLGHWLQPTILHWVLVTRADAGGVGFNDPWGGHRKALAWGAFLPLYGGQVVTVLRARDPVL